MINSVFDDLKEISTLYDGAFLCVYTHWLNTFAIKAPS